MRQDEKESNRESSYGFPIKEWIIRATDKSGLPDYTNGQVLGAKNSINCAPGSSWPKSGPVTFSTKSVCILCS